MIMHITFNLVIPPTQVGGIQSIMQNVNSKLQTQNFLNFEF